MLIDVAKESLRKCDECQKWKDPIIAVTLEEVGFFICLGCATKLEEELHKCLFP